MAVGLAQAPLMVRLLVVWSPVRWAAATLRAVSWLLLSTASSTSTILVRLVTGS